jgi:hypothetical protein
VAACVGFYFLTARFLGPVVWLFVAMLSGPAFARIVIDVSAEMGWRFRSAVLKPLSGTNYRFQTFAVHVLESEDHCRWIATQEVRKIVGQLVGDAVLAKLFPSGYQCLGKEQKGYLRDDAMVAHLGQASTPQAIKFKNWVERNIAFPAQRVRCKKGIYIKPACETPDD